MEYLGSGSYGDVLKCRHKLDKQFYAVKRIELGRNKKDRNEKAYDTFQTFCEGIQIKKNKLSLFVYLHLYLVPIFTCHKSPLIKKKL